MRDEVLMAVGSTEPTTFREFCDALGDSCPDTSDKSGWRDLIRVISQLEKEKLIQVERNNKGLIDNMILTDAGAEMVRADMDKKRGLFRGM